jgi:hypothetical protein
LGLFGFGEIEHCFDVAVTLQAVLSFYDVSFALTMMTATKIVLKNVALIVGELSQAKPHLGCLDRV